MVGRLVEHQDVGLLQHQPAENHARRFAAGERIGLLERILAAEEHLAEHAAQFLLRSLRIELVQPVDDGDALAECDSL